MLKLKDIKKTYVVDDKRFPALKNINLTFPDKGFVAILGPSGCGKTTLLNLIGGLDQYTSGDLIINHKSTKKFTDRDWDAYRNKRVGFVFQTYNLVPHLTVLGNVELSMTLTGMSKKERQKKAAIALKRVGLKDTIKKKPNQLSGGQMQRVAIARSLVNNPEIVLADEPTGALDSVTSVQVMEILKEVSKDRLVIMVTHNVELAKQYSTRIIRLKDGKVISDTNPQKGSSKIETEELQQEKNKHTHMSFFTALGSSAKSLLTKKGRTAMTAVAASFGIIGVALVLAMSNGFQGYVNRVEMATASTVPITISPYVTTAIKEIQTPEQYPSEEVIKPYEQDISQLVVIHRNFITQDYSDYCKKLLDTPQQYASSVLENHEYLDFNIFTKRGDSSDPNASIIKVNQFDAAGAGASILSGTTGLPSTIFHELYGGEEYIKSLYDVINGHYPTSELTYNEEDNCYHGEVCLVCDRYNRLPVKTLYKLGLSATETATEDAKINFDKIIGHEYKMFMPEEVYKAVDGETPAFSIPLGAGEYYELGKTAEGLPDIKKLVLGSGKTISAYTDVSATNSGGTPKYEPELKTLYGKTPEIKLTISGIIRPTKTSLVNLMPGSICYNTSLKEHYIKKISEDTFVKDTLAPMAKNNFYIPLTASAPDPETGKTLWEEFVLAALSTTVSGNTNNLDAFLKLGLPTTYGTLSSAANSEDFAKNWSFNDYTKSNYRVANIFKQPELTGYIPFEEYQIPTDVVPGTFDDLNDVLMHVSGYSPITSVLVFPKDLGSKAKVFSYLDAWNNQFPEKDGRRVLYSDLAGTLTDALGTMIDIISIVLIVFSSVSLLVSCVMTGVITYTSVLERTKEIGILRAIGARKKDVGRLFEAESVIIGGIAGLAGVLFTFIVQWPISLIINARFPEQQIGMICNLSPWHALILVIISILLTFIAGFIPARKASKKDPVVALRTE